MYNQPNKDRSFRYVGVPTDEAIEQQIMEWIERITDTPDFPFSIRLREGLNDLLAEEVAARNASKKRGDRAVSKNSIINESLAERYARRMKESVKRQLGTTEETP